MRKAEITFKTVLILFTITLIGCNSTKNKTTQSDVNLLIGLE
jgi:hypothetical protein